MRGWPSCCTPKAPFNPDTCIFDYNQYQIHRTVVTSQFTCILGNGPDMLSRRRARSTVVGPWQVQDALRMQALLISTNFRRTWRVPGRLVAGAVSKRSPSLTAPSR